MAVYMSLEIHAQFIISKLPFILPTPIAHSKLHTETNWKHM